ncbi:MAG TPA: urease accessory UreF family protein, partial [Ramlibacter sp.]|nr:urease accessory UreF family protein [Ramlibacter sp.]
MDTAPIPTDAALLQLIWLASPALPVGGFSYSEGLEAAVEAGLVHDEDSASSWIAAQLHASLARADLSIVCAGVAAARAGDGERLAQLDAWVRRTRETGEF